LLLYSPLEDGTYSRSIINEPSERLICIALRAVSRSSAVILAVKL